MSCERKRIIALVHEAVSSGANQERACDVIDISTRTYQRWVKSNTMEDGRINATHSPNNKFTELERQRVIRVVNESEFASLSPCQIVPKLADQGQYIASESSIYRILKDNEQLKHREKNKPTRKVIKPRALTADGPNQIYTWDITYLPTRTKGVFFYLYLVLDIFSRKIVGWQIHHEELSSLAADLMKDICLREKIERDQVTLHSDNGSPMKGAMMLATLQELGVMPSFSRPSVSNDNPYSESMFRTLKYRPNYPEKPFADIAAARQWVGGFVHWYNNEHCHSGISYVTPSQRHNGDDIAILKKRKLVYQKAKSRNPGRWSGDIRNWDRIDQVHLNPEKCKTEDKKNKAA